MSQQHSSHSRPTNNSNLLKAHFNQLLLAKNKRSDQAAQHTQSSTKALVQSASIQQS
jgi:hypothetical protein